MTRSLPNPRPTFGVMTNNQFFELRATTEQAAIQEAEAQYALRAGDYVECIPGGIVKRYGKSHGSHQRVNKFNDRRRGRNDDSPRTAARREWDAK